MAPACRRPFPRLHTSPGSTAEPAPVQNPWCPASDCPAAEPPSLAEQVSDLQERHDNAMTLLGEIVATLPLPQNEPHIHPKLASMAATWRDRFEQMEAR